MLNPRGHQYSIISDVLERFFVLSSQARILDLEGRRLRLVVGRYMTREARLGEPRQHIETQFRAAAEGTDEGVLTDWVVYGTLIPVSRNSRVMLVPRSSGVTFAPWNACPRRCAHSMKGARASYAIALSD